MTQESKIPWLSLPQQCPICSEMIFSLTQKPGFPFCDHIMRHLWDDLATRKKAEGAEKIKDMSITELVEYVYGDEKA